MRLLSPAAIALALAAGVLLACATASQPPDQTQEPAQEPAASPSSLADVSSLDGAGRALADLLMRRFPDYADGRVAVGWASRYDWLAPLGAGFVARWRGSVAFADLGAVASTDEQAFDQLDPATFAGLVWLQPGMTGQGELGALKIRLRSTRSLPPAELLVPITPPVALLQKTTPAAASSLRPWLTLSEVPGALFWETPADRLWVALPDKILRLDPVSRQPVQTWSLPAVQGQEAFAPVALASLGAEADAAQVGYFAGGRGGWWYVRGPGGDYQRGPDLQGFPLSDRLARFLTAPFDPASKAFQVADFKGEPLATCTSMVRFLGPAGSLFGLLEPDGKVKVLRGSDFGLEPGPEPGSATAIAGGGPLLFVAAAGDLPVVRGFRLTAGDAWEKAWESLPLPAPAQALSLGVVEGRPVLFIVTAEHGTGDIYVADLPQGSG